MVRISLPRSVLKTTRFVEVSSVSEPRTHICLYCLALPPSTWPDQTIEGSITFPLPTCNRVWRDHSSAYPDSQRTASISDADEKLAWIGVPRRFGSVVARDVRATLQEDIGGGIFWIRKGVRRMLAAIAVSVITQVKEV